MTLRTLLLTAVAGCFIHAACANEHPLRKDWIILGQPQRGGGLDIGVGFAGSGGTDPNCYYISDHRATDSVQTASSATRYGVTWNASTKGTFHVQVADLVGLRTAVTRSSRGSITFDTIVIRRASA